MNIKKSLFSALLTAALSVSSLPLTAAAADEHKLTLLDYNGNSFAVLTVSDGETPDLSKYETSSSLNYHEDDYTEVRFSCWSVPVKSVTSDLTVRALNEKMTIAKYDMPKRKEYYSKKGRVRTDGLKITITRLTQTPDASGANGFTTVSEVTDISEACRAVPETLDKAFAEGDTAVISIVPPGSDKTIATYRIKYFEGLGDVNYDGSVNSSDASSILTFYSMYATGHDPGLTEERFKRCDIDRNGSIDSSDASAVLTFYARSQTSSSDVYWEDILR